MNTTIDIREYLALKAENAALAAKLQESQAECLQDQKDFDDIAGALKRTNAKLKAAEAEVSSLRTDNGILRSDNGLLQQRTSWQRCETHGGYDAKRAWGCPECVVSLKQRLKAAEAECERLRDQLTMAQRNNHSRNVELDALHFVWCDGGCRGGVHRFGEHPALTAEIVAAAEWNTRRMRRWYGNSLGREAPPTVEERIPVWLQAERAVHAEYVKLESIRFAELEKRNDALVEALGVLATEENWYCGANAWEWEPCEDMPRNPLEFAKAALATSSPPQ